MTTLLDLLKAQGPNVDPFKALLGVGVVWLHRHMMQTNGADIARNLAEAYKPEGVP